MGKNIKNLEKEGRVSISPQKNHNAKWLNELEPFDASKRDKNGTSFSPDFSSDQTLFDFLRELSERKKMSFLQPIPHVQYRCCTLTEGKVWYISFYVTHPATGKLRRIRMKFNRESNLRKRRKEAKEVMEAINVRLALGWNPLKEETVPKGYSTLKDALDRFLTVKGKESEPNTMRSYKSFVKTFSEWMKKQGNPVDSAYASSVTKGTALSFMSDMEEGLSAKTYNNYLAFFRTLFTWLCSKGYADSNPFDGMTKKAKKLTKKHRRILTNSELSTLVAYLSGKNKEYLAMCMICYACLIRPKELAMLKCKDIDIEKQLIHVSPEIAKNDNDSYRTIPDGLLPLLGRLDYSHPDWYLFGQNNGGGDFRPSKKMICSRKIAQWWNHDIRPACNFGMDIQFYSLKDTGITNMLTEGIPINIVQQQADHSSVAMTAIYVGKTAEADNVLKEVVMPKKTK